MLQYNTLPTDPSVLRAGELEVSLDFFCFWETVAPFAQLIASKTDLLQMTDTPQHHHGKRAVFLNCFRDDEFCGVCFLCIFNL